MAEETTPTETPPGNTEADAGGDSNNEGHFLSEEMQSNEAFKDFKTPDDLANAYLESTKSVEAIEADKYEFAMEGADEESISALSNGLGETASALGLNQEQAQGMLKHIADREALVAETAEKVATEARSEAEAALKKDWGAKYEENMATVDKSVQAFVDEDTRKFLVDNNLADHPGVIKLFHLIGSKMSEASFVSGDEGPGPQRKIGKDGKAVLSFPSMKQ